jgi:B12-binding domain/radical SAM domain protein
MAKHALAFAFDHDNIQSLSALIGAVEADGRFDDLEIHLLKPRLGLSEQVEALAETHERVVLGFSFTTPQAPQALQDVQEIRTHLQAHRLTNVTLIAGGPHPSGAWQHTLGMGFDVVVVGEGEFSFPPLLSALYAGSSLGQLTGIAYRDGADVCYAGRSARVERLDDWPPFAEGFRLFSSIEITRGCPWACKYCQTTFLFGGRMRHRSVEDIVRWARVSKRHDRLDMRFITPNAFSYGSDGESVRLDLLAEMLRGVNEVVGREHTYFGSFPSEVRPESVSTEAVELVREFAINDTIFIGAQSGSQRMLDLAHRGNTVEDVYRAVEITQGAGLTASVDFIFGMPGEQEEDRTHTRRVISDLVDMGAKIHSHVFMPLAGTPWEAAPPGRIDEETLRLLDHLTGKGQHFGQWRRQQSAAGAIASFRRSTDDQ